LHRRGIKNYAKFWNQRNKKFMQENLRPSMSEDALLKLPYIETNPQFTTRKSVKLIFGDEEAVNDFIALKEDLSTFENMQDYQIDKNRYIPDSYDSIHVIRNSGDYYVQESLAKSHSPLHKITYKDILTARDIFSDRLGNINIRAAKEGIMQELNKSVIHLLKRQGRRKKQKRDKSFKKVQSKAKIAELERMLQSMEAIKKPGRNNIQTSFTLPRINLSIKQDDSKIDEAKELPEKIFTSDISKIIEVNTEDQSKLKKRCDRRNNFWKGIFVLNVLQEKH
jgi:hypothetical protein